MTTLRLNSPSPSGTTRKTTSKKGHAICGIAGIHFKNPDFVSSAREQALLERFVDYLLLGIEKRGTDATGFVAQTTTGSTLLDKHAIPASNFIKVRKRLPKGVRTVLLHARLTTRGKAENWHNNHPVQYGSVFTTHNGTISNDTYIFNHVLKKDRHAEVDTESIAALLDFHGFEEAHKGFAELRGGFATASIDPINHRGQVILAKGPSYPIVFHENKHFCVWASEEGIIRNAWGEVLGTPSKKYETFAEGDIYILGDEVERKPKAFDAKRYDYSTSRNSRSSTTTNHQHNWGDEWDDDDWYGYEEGWVKNGGTTPLKPKRNYEVLDLVDTVAELRHKKQGVCVTFRTKGEDRHAEWMEKYFNDKWTYCPHCKDTCAALQCMPNTEKWGVICFDCYAYAVGGEQEKKKEAVQNTSEYLESLDIDDEIYDGLVEFGDLQMYLHVQALYRLMRETGIKRTILDYILFHAPDSILNRDQDILGLYIDLSDRYQSHVADLTARYLEDAQEQERLDAREEARKTGWVADSCGVIVEAEEEKPPVIDPTKCLVCGRKARTILGTTGAWCKKHWSTCAGHVAHPYSEKCKGETVGMTRDGHRWCHIHARQKRGYVADNDKQARERLHKELEAQLVH